MEWFRDRWTDLAGLGSAAWLTIAAWTGLLLAIVALIFVTRAISRNRQLKRDELRPHVVMYMEPSATDWHVIELVVRNFGKSAAHDIEFDFGTPLTVGRYEDAYADGPPDITELRLPSELTQLAPGQEWRTVWDSAISRAELGGEIRSRFDGSLTYRDRAAGDKGKPQEYTSAVLLDWDSLPPVQRLDLMLNHDLAKREKQKLELLRSMLTYFHYASKETRPEVFRSEIDRMNRAVRETQDRWRTRQVDQTTELDFPWIDDKRPGGRHHSSPAIGIRNHAP
ncbi:hypothetical protein SBI67_26800 [Mycolicibacterium sp. 120266]|uniref:hypothetical protein n=1 Tax=Mycolicibacterium sp. 120266 TaxID=3090601 RepID=UPI00299D9667|nr:hypothetical protein [Mycolicibacterium sp. 120266]MDX1875743.1 hypothetical protein [Mycolicibacterium sp. 120266]